MSRPEASWYDKGFLHSPLVNLSRHQSGLGFRLIEPGMTAIVGSLEMRRPMSRRINLSGFSLGQMRRLFGSRDEQAIVRIRDNLIVQDPRRGEDLKRQIGEIVERAIMTGVPFADLGEETYVHAMAARALAADGQEWQVTSASGYHDSALEEGLWKLARKLASPQTKAFLRGLIEGVPLFWVPAFDRWGHVRRHRVGKASVFPIWAGGSPRANRLPS